MENQELKRIGNAQHSLFKHSIPETRTQIDENSFACYPPHTKYRLFINEFSENENELHEVFNTLWEAEENDTLEIRINSRGGYIHEGQIFYNIIKNVFPNKTTTVLDTRGYSMGALLFCCGDIRIVMEHSDLMFHDYSSGEFGKGQEIESSVNHYTKYLRSFFKAVIVDKGFLSPKEFEQMSIGKDFYMDTIEMCKRKIATHVLVDGKLIKAKKYLKKHKKGK